MTRYLALMIAAVFITLAGATMLPLALLWDPRSNLCLRADAAEAQRCTEWWEASIMMVVLAMACGAAAFALRMALPPAARNTQARNDLEGMSRNAWKGSAPPALLFVASPRPPAPLGMHMEASHMTQRATRNAGEQGSPASPTEKVLKAPNWYPASLAHVHNFDSLQALPSTDGRLRTNNTPWDGMLPGYSLQCRPGECTLARNPCKLHELATKLEAVAVAQQGAQAD